MIRSIPRAYSPGWAESCRESSRIQVHEGMLPDCVRQAKLGSFRAILLQPIQSDPVQPRATHGFHDSPIDTRRRLRRYYCDRYWKTALGLVRQTTEIHHNPEAN